MSLWINIVIFNHYERMCNGEEQISQKIIGSMRQIIWKNRIKQPQIFRNSESLRNSNTSAGKWTVSEVGASLKYASLLGMKALCGKSPSSKNTGFKMNECIVEIFVVGRLT